MSQVATSAFGNITEAIEKALKASNKKRRFVQSVEMIITLKDVDLKKPENRINTVVALPNPPPKKLSKIVVIASGDTLLKAREAGVDLVIDRDELQKMANDKKTLKKLAKRYDFFLAQTDLMVQVGRVLGKYLGPRGKMPQPLPPNAPIAPIVERLRRSIRIRIREDPVVMCRIGTEDQPVEQLAANAKAVLDEILKKFTINNIKNIYIKLTMGSPVKVEKAGVEK
ncbi:50S ribosomal protein L1 [Infirmifilum uzonense]|uniref:50S ribosomal protein L1 n=1 Tax=Infirmifilum uzonense TaxID=1550241 RepID=UPI003C707D32